MMVVLKKIKKTTLEINKTKGYCYKKNLNGIAETVKSLWVVWMMSRDTILKTHSKCTAPIKVQDSKGKQHS